MNVVAFAGLDVLTRTNQTNSATIFILLKPWDERGEGSRPSTRSPSGINGKLFGMKDAVGFAFNLPEIPGLGATVGRRGQPAEPLGQGRPRLRAAGAGVPGGGRTSCRRCRAMTTTFRANVPQVYLDVDRATRQGARA